MASLVPVCDPTTWDENFCRQVGQVLRVTSLTGFTSSLASRDRILLCRKDLRVQCRPRPPAVSPVVELIHYVDPFFPSLWGHVRGRGRGTLDPFTLGGGGGRWDVEYP